MKRASIRSISQFSTIKILDDFIFFDNIIKEEKFVERDFLWKS